MKRNILSLALFGALTLPNISSAITVGGVTWNSNSIFDFGMQAAIWETEAATIGDTVTFFGTVAQLNGTANFVTPGAELSYYGTFELLDVGDYDLNSKQDLVFGNATMEFFYDATSNFDAENSATAQDGTSWLTLTGHNFDFWGAQALAGSIFSELDAGTDIADIGDTGGGFGAWDVAGGPAGSFLDTNTITAINGFGLSPNADFSFSVSFEPSPNPELLIASGELVGDSTVPEPASLLLLSIGLIGASVANKKYKRFL